MNPKRVNEDWLVTVINTLDPTYFSDMIEKAELSKLKAGSPEDKIMISTEMMQVLKQFVTIGAKKSNQRSSVRSLKINSKKRKRPSVERRTERFDRAIRPTFNAKRQ